MQNDSFINNPKLVEWPTALGHYWFYGYRYGRGSDTHENQKELMLCEVFKVSNNGAILAGNGQIFSQAEVEEALFIPATLPELPA
jgi:hypothetical protein